MKGHGAIEIRLGGSHPQSDGSHLDDFGGVAANHVASQHPITAGFDHQLEQTPGTTLRQGLVHVTESGFVDGDGISAVAFFGVLFAQANAGQFRLREHRCGHQVMVHRACASGEQSIGNGATFIDRHRGQVDAIGDITNGINVGNVGALMCINSDAMPVMGNARLL